MAHCDCHCHVICGNPECDGFRETCWCGTKFVDMKCPECEDNKRLFIKEWLDGDYDGEGNHETPEDMREMMAQGNIWPDDLLEIPENLGGIPANRREEYKATMKIVMEKEEEEQKKYAEEHQKKLDKLTPEQRNLYEQYKNKPMNGNLVNGKMVWEVKLPKEVMEVLGHC